MKKKMRTIQPAHESDKFTVEEAMEAWRRVEARVAARGGGRAKSRDGKRPPVVSQKAPSTSAKVAAEHEKKSPER